MSISLFATKIGMTQIFEGFEKIPVTILQINQNKIINKFLSKDRKKHIIQLGYQDVKEKHINKAILGYFKKLNIKPKRYLKEFNVCQDIFSKFNVGDNINPKDILDYKYLKARGTSIGKGFAGVMKRHNFGGFPASHGTHEMFRHGGSIGCRTQPGRVFKGKKMPGRMGSSATTICNIKIIKYIDKYNYLIVKGSVPGHRKSILNITCYNI